jgi:phosphate transport system substrate-binding protein
MKKKIGLGATAIALSLGLATAGIAPAMAAGALSGGGATFQADFQAKCLAKFNGEKVAVNKGIAVSYAGVGSGNGRTGLGNGTYAFAGTDSLGTKTGLSAADSVYLPAVAAPLAIIINLKSTTNTKITSLNLTPEVLSDILRGNITVWDNSRIKALNSALKLPATDITVVSRSDSSGSTGNLKNYLAQNSTFAWPQNETNSGFATGQTGSGAPAVVAKVAAVSGAIGYADLSDTTTAVTLVAIMNKAGSYVKPTATGAANYVKAAGVLTPKTDAAVTTNGGIYTVDFTKNVKSAYQISFISYMVGKKGINNTDTKVYLNYMLTKCSTSPSAVGAGSYTTVGTTLLNVAKAQVAKL